MAKTPLCLSCPDFSKACPEPSCCAEPSQGVRAAAQVFDGHVNRWFRWPVVDVAGFLVPFCLERVGNGFSTQCGSAAPGDA